MREAQGRTRPRSGQPATEAHIHVLTCTQLIHVDSHTYLHTSTSAHLCPPHLPTHVLTHAHTPVLYTCSDGAHAHKQAHVSAHTCAHASGHWLATCPHMHTITLTFSVCRPTLVPSDTPGAPIPDGDHVPTVTLDVPAAVGARWVVEGPGWAVDDTASFRVLLQFPAAGGCQERRLRGASLTFGWEGVVREGDT